MTATVCLGACIDMGVALRQGNKILKARMMFSRQCSTDPSCAQIAKVWVNRLTNERAEYQPRLLRQSFWSEGRRAATPNSPSDAVIGVVR